MLNEKMTLANMLEFKPSDEDMAMLDLDVTLYIKLSIISIEKEINYNLIRHLFNHELKDELTNTFKNLYQTTFYDFAYKNDTSTRFITISELYSLKNLAETESLIEDLFKDYSNDAEMVIDIYTHDNHEHRISNLDGIYKVDIIK